MLKRSVRRIVVVGAGGTGSWLLAPLARFLAAEEYKGTLVIVDGDKYSEDNMLRQEFDRKQLHRNKADVWSERLYAQYLDLQVSSVPHYLSDTNATELIQNGDVIFICADNHGARARITYQARSLKSVVVINAGNEIVDGHVHVFIRRGGKSLTRDVVQDHPEIARGAETGRGDPTAACDNIGKEGGAQLMVANVWSAAMCFAMFHKLWILEEAAGRRRNLTLDQEVNWNSVLLKTLPLPVPPVLEDVSCP